MSRVLHIFLIPVMNRLQFAFEVGILAIFGHLEKKQREELKENYCIIDKGYNSFPTNIPGTAYRKALQVQNK